MEYFFFILKIKGPNQSALFQTQLLMKILLIRNKNNIYF